MNNCEHVIGMIYDYDNTDLISLAGLKQHIEVMRREKEYQDRMGFKSNMKVFTLSDYADGRKSTDLTQFDYCPFCGTKIDWKAIKKEGDSK